MKYFPLACFIQRSDTQQLIDSQKLKIINNYRESKDLSRKNNVKIYNDKIAQLNKKINTLRSKKIGLTDSIKKLNRRNFDLDLELKILKNDLIIHETKREKVQIKKSKSDSLFSIQLIQDLVLFKKSINEAELPLYQLTEIATLPKGIAIIVSFNILLIYILFLTTSLAHNNKYYYSKEVSLAYRKIIETEHKKNISECNKILNEKFNYSYEFTSIYSDSPFNSFEIKSLNKPPKFDGLLNYFKNIPIEKNEQI